MEADITINDVSESIDAAEAAKERLKTDPDAVRKILAGDFGVSDDVTVYPIKSLNKKYADLHKRLGDLSVRAAKNDDETHEDWIKRIGPMKAELDSLRTEFETVEAELKESAVTFHMSGISKKAIKNLRREARKQFPLPKEGGTEDPSDAEDRDKWYHSAIIAAHLAQDGYTVDDIIDIDDKWPSACWNRLWVTAQRLSIQDDYLSGALTPDFS